ncbi:Arc family DNA-binding protein [Burkholderia pyrrocinia]
MNDIYRSQYRLPWALYEQLKESAEKNRRSLNAELVARLQSTFPQLEVHAGAELQSVRDSISTMSLGEVMTSDEITVLAKRILELAAHKGGSNRA